MSRCETHNISFTTENCPRCHIENVHEQIKQQEQKAKVIPLNNVTRLDLPPERILAVLPNLSGVVLMGRDKDGEYYFASSYADGGEVLWLIEKLKRALMGD